MRAESEIEAGPELDTLQVEIETSEALDQFATALAAAQEEMEPASKDSENPHFKSKYSDLAAVIKACRPLAKHGIARVQIPGLTATGVTVVTTLIHKSGQWMKGTLEIPLQQRTAQAVGSAITYGRRYSLQAMVGIASDDDDGNAATEAPPRYVEPKKAQPEAQTTPKAGATKKGGQTSRGAQVAAKMKPLAAAPPLPEAWAPKVEFPVKNLKGRTLASLNTQELREVLEAAEAGLLNHSTDQWAPILKAQIDTVEAEFRRRDDVAAEAALAST